VSTYLPPNVRVFIYLPYQMCYPKKAKGRPKPPRNLGWIEADLLAQASTTIVPEVL
jgi:hypothetical protein